VRSPTEQYNLGGNLARKKLYRQSYSQTFTPNCLDLIYSLGCLNQFNILLQDGVIMYTTNTSRLISYMKMFLLVALFFSLTACATGHVKYRNSSLSNSDIISGYLSKPDGDGPFPAVVLLHGCAGLGLDTTYKGDFKNLQRYQTALREAGFVSLIVDSYGSRGMSTKELWTSSCGGLDKWERQVDLTGAIRYLKTLPYVIPKIGAVGQSQGGRMALVASGWKKTSFREQLLTAAVAVYPSCILTRPRVIRTPLLILIGDADLVTPASHCQEWVDEFESEIGDELDVNGQPVGVVPEIVIYPGVYHEYDMTGTGGANPLGNAFPNSKAAKDTRDRIIAFFRKHLR
jgi:dienelactone hydrolase